MHLDELNRRLEAASETRAVGIRKENAIQAAILKAGVVALGVITLLYMLSFAHILGYVPFGITMTVVVVGGLGLLAWIHVALERATEACSGPIR